MYGSRLRSDAASPSQLTNHAFFGAGLRPRSREISFHTIETLLTHHPNSISGLRWGGTGAPWTGFLAGAGLPSAERLGWQRFQWI